VIHDHLELRDIDWTEKFHQDLTFKKMKKNLRRGKMSSMP
jgi:hypothetical protein